MASAALLVGASPAITRRAAASSVAPVATATSASCVLASLGARDRGIQQQDGRWILATNLRNPSSHPALMVRVKVVREKTGDRILPAIYSDNYLALMPGESEGVRVELAVADSRGEKPRIVVEGFNVGKVIRP